MEQTSFIYKRILVASGIAFAVTLAYLLRGVLVPLFFAFLVAYALDPFVDRLEAIKIPRGLGALIVMLALTGIVTLIFMYGAPIFVEEFRTVAHAFPDQMQRLLSRAAPWLHDNFRIDIPSSYHDINVRKYLMSSEVWPTVKDALFGTLGYVGVVLSAFIIPVFALYLLIDFDRIVGRAGQLIPRRWVAPATAVAADVHRTLGGYVRGQLTACFVLAALYATGLRIVDIRLAVPIGVLTGFLAFVPYVGFGFGLLCALAMATLDWHGFGPLIGVIAVMGGVQILDGMVITPRIVGRSVGLAPLEVIITMMAAGSLLGFFGVLLAVPLGAIVKIFIRRVVRVYLASDFYKKPSEAGAAEPPPKRRSIAPKAEPQAQPSQKPETTT